MEANQKVITTNSFIDYLKAHFQIIAAILPQLSIKEREINLLVYSVYFSPDGTPITTFERRQIAAELGLSPTNYSNISSTLKDKGLIIKNKRTYRVHPNVLPNQAGTMLYSIKLELHEAGR